MGVYRRQESLWHRDVASGQHRTHFQLLFSMLESQLGALPWARWKAKSNMLWAEAWKRQVKALTSKIPLRQELLHSSLDNYSFKPLPRRGDPAAHSLAIHACSRQQPRIFTHSTPALCLCASVEKELLVEHSLNKWIALFGVVRGASFRAIHSSQPSFALLPLALCRKFSQGQEET